MINGPGADTVLHPLPVAIQLISVALFAVEKRPCPATFDPHAASRCFHPGACGATYAARSSNHCPVSCFAAVGQFERRISVLRCAASNPWWTKGPSQKGMLLGFTDSWPRDTVSRQRSSREIQYREMFDGLFPAVSLFFLFLQRVAVSKDSISFHFHRSLRFFFPFLFPVFLLFYMYNSSSLK